MQIASKKLAFIAVVFFILLLYLGYWQLSRAEEKKALLKLYQHRLRQPFLTQLPLNQEVRFNHVQLTGIFDNAHTFLLDNKILHHQIGYQVYTPFICTNGIHILVDRGFVPLSVKRDILPKIIPINGKISINGMLNLPPSYFVLGKETVNEKLTWPLRVQSIDLATLAKYLSASLFPYILILDGDSMTPYMIDRHLFNVPYEKHIAYAIQWFAMAATLLILFLVLNFRAIRNQKY